MSLLVSPEKFPSSPPPSLNTQYFRSQWVHIENLHRLDPDISWKARAESSIKWLSYNEPGDLNSGEDDCPLGIILLGQLGKFSKLKCAENHFDQDKPEFSLQLVVDIQSLDILRDLIRRRERKLNVMNPLRIKVAEADVDSPFTPGTAFPAIFDGASTNDDHDGDSIDASCFAEGDKIAVQAWFGSYMFTDRAGKASTGPTFRLLKLWRLEAASAPPRLNCTPPTKRRRLF